MSSHEAVYLFIEKEFWGIAIAPILTQVLVTAVFLVIIRFYFDKHYLHRSSRKSEGLSITEEIEEDISIGSFAGSKVINVN